MNKLTEDFSLKKYGLKVQLVNENDAAFILSLRANPKRTKYMVTLTNNILSQKKWIQEYKKREKKGLDYYFIYSNFKEKPIGLNRISHIDFDTKTAKTSSWIAVKGLNYEAIKMIMIQNEIVFNFLKIDNIWCDVNYKNKRAIRILELLKYSVKDTSEKYLQFYLEKEDFFKAYKSTIIDKLQNQ